MPRLAIVSAMAEELQGLHAHLRGAREVRRAGRDFSIGQLEGQDAVLVLSRIGKVAAATTAAVLLTEFDVDRLLFTGVAGGVAGPVQVGDVVVADTLLQHDMDASPLFPRYEVPLYGRAHFDADPALSASVHAAVEQALGLRVHRGLVLSGDRFVCSAAESAALREAFPAALAVEMEGAALAQVCHDFGVPFAVMRTISDRADDDAHVDFSRFITDVAARYTVQAVRALARSMA